MVDRIDHEPRIDEAGSQARGEPQIHAPAPDALQDDRFRARLLENQRLEAVGRLASGMAHDFNNLLATIDGNAQLALMDVEPQHPLRESLEDIRIAVRRGRELTDQMLAFSRRQVLEPVVVELNELLDEFRPMLTRMLGGSIAMTLAPHPGLGKIFADPAQIRQVLIHLVAYSRASMPDGGRLRIETCNFQVEQAELPDQPVIESGPYVRLTQVDDGRGLSADELAHAFDPFYSTDSLATSLGLGLASVYGIVSQHEGFVQIASTPGGGTTFHLNFPRVPARIDTGRAARGPKGLPTGYETILLVEDDDNIRAMIRRILDRLGYRVIEAASSLEALRLSDEILNSVDLLLTDVILPGQDGRELTDSLQNRIPGLRSLFMSGFPEDVLNSHRIDVSSPEFLPKPFTPAVLARMVRTVLDGAGK